VFERLTLWGAVGALFVVGVFPVAMMLFDSIFVSGGFSLVHYHQLLLQSSAWRLMGRTLVLALLTTFFATAVGAPLGFVFGKTDLPFRRSLAAVFVFPLLLPPYVNAISWFKISGRTGFAARLLGHGSGELLSQLFFGLPGCVWVLSLVFAPVPMLLTTVSLKAVPPRLEEAAKLVGPWSLVIKSISVPLAKNGILFGSIVVFVLAAGEFTVPNFLRYDTFPVLSFTRFTASYDFAGATAAAAPIAIVIFAIVALEARYLKGDQPVSRLSHANPLVVPLQRLRWPIFLLIAAFASAAVLAPISSLLSDTGLSSIATAFSQSLDSALRGLLYSGMAAGLLTLIGLILAWMAERRALPVGHLTEFISLVLFALPGTVVAIGLIHLWNRPTLNLVYASPVILVFAYVAQYTGLGMRLVRASIAMIPNSLEEAGRMAGVGWPRRMRSIVTPLARPGLALSFAAGFLFCQRDVALPLMLAPPGLDTLSARTMTLMANGSPSLISAMCLLIIAGTVLTTIMAALLVRSVKRT
jgi:iron(III) transport system permease protein